MGLDERVGRHAPQLRHEEEHRQAVHAQRRRRVSHHVAPPTPVSTAATADRPAVNARDRIGNGPWHNAKGVLIARDVTELHGDIHRDRNNVVNLPPGSNRPTPEQPRRLVIDGLSGTATVCREEIFGPVLSVVRSPDYETAARLINEHEFGKIFGTSKGVPAFQAQIDAVLNAVIPYQSPQITYHLARFDVA